LFDTEHMRVAGAWVGKPVVYAADKNMGPAVDGNMIFATGPGPGWAKDGKWDDPRAGREGPLPRDWAHYRGLYVHGDKVVLSYTVGECAVLEVPGCVKSEKLTAITRTFHLGPSARPLAILVCDNGPNAVWTTNRGLKLAPKPGLAVSPKCAAHLIAGVVGAPPGSKWNAVGDRLHFELPAIPTGAKFQLIVASDFHSGNFGEFVSLLQGNVQDGRALTKGGPPHWQGVVETNAVKAPAGKFPYVVDDIDLPVANPWHASIRFGGLDFFPDGRAALCTWDGDVWIVSGLDGKLDKVRWNRFASGLQQPLGLKIVNGFIYTAGRDQITKLHDLNGDGEANFYENFNNDAGLTLQRHEFVMDLQTDAQGNFYFGRSGHYHASKRGDNCCVYKLTPDGKKLEVFARGFREPNGLSIGPDGTMIVGDNEGNGVPQTPLYRFEAGDFYGFRPSLSPEKGVKGATWEYTRKPIVWLPVSVDRSAGSQVWATDERFGPLKGQLLHTSYGHCALYGVLIDKKAEPWQGAVWKLPLAFSSGVMRARLNPKDGQLYLCGLRGWDTNAVKDGQFCRVRYTGKPSAVPVGFEVVKGGRNLTFSQPLERTAAEDDGNWSGTWSDAIGKTGKLKKGKQDLPIAAVRLSADGKTAKVAIDKMRPMSNFSLQYRLKAADGSVVSGALHGTVHRVP
jgi:glucose/arabinose dehydrogenase